MEVTAPPGDVAALPEKEADEPGLEDDVAVQVRTFFALGSGLMRQHPITCYSCHGQLPCLPMLFLYDDLHHCSKLR